MSTPVHGNNPPLELINLVKKYGSFTAVQNVNLKMRPGEVFGLLGPNGAGKTTIISILMTLTQPTSGEARIFGKDVTLSDPATKVLVGFVPQETVSHGFFTVDEVLKFHSGYYGLRENQEQIEFLLSRLGLMEHRQKRVSQLSGGMKRRLLIAKALVHKPRLLILDEPTAGVDIELRTSLWNFVRELNRDGVSILLTTHYLEEAEQLCDRIGIIHKGELKAIDQTKHLVHQLTTKEVTLFLNQPVPDFSHPQKVSQDGEKIVLQVTHEEPLGPIVEKLGSKLQDVKIREGRLEDAFLRLVWENNKNV